MTGKRSNVVHLEDHAAPEDRASRWIARIDAGPLTPEEREELRAWLASDPGNAALLDAQAMLWSSAARARFPQASSTGRPASAGFWASSWASWWRRPAAVGLSLGSVAVASVMAVVLLRPAAEVQPAHYATEVGRTSAVRLDDGSVLHLNTASRTTVAYSGQRRLIVLERGEGYFEVAKDARRPFDVVAGDTVVRAVGTKFSVHQLDGGRVEVVVTEGVVELLRKGEKNQPVEAGFSRPVRLAQGQSGLQVGSSLLVTQRDEKRLEDKLSWLHGRLTFDSEPLGEIVAQVNRYSTRRIVIADPALRELKVSGSFNVGEVPVFLNSLEQGFGLRIDEVDGVTRIARGGS